MGRLLVLILLVVLAVWLVRRALRGKTTKSEVGKQAASRGKLVQCAYCGVHLPGGEARAAAGELYCSDEHARLGKR
jgi:uncharacterized protein